MAELQCGLCLSKIINKRAYRKLCDTDLNGIMPSTVQRPDTACMNCYNKVNKVKYFGNDVAKKIANLKEKRDELLRLLLELPGVKNTSKISTPSHCATKKRPLQSPSGATPKSKKSLFTTPSKKSLFSTPRSSRSTDTGRRKTHQSTQTSIQSSDFNVKVSVKYGRGERTKIITDHIQQSVIKGFVNRTTPLATMKNLAKDIKYRSAMTKTIAKYVCDEVNKIVKLRETLLRAISVDNILTFDWMKAHTDMCEKLPLLLELLSCFLNNDKVANVPRIVMAVSILLYSRNQTINITQLLLGLVLDSCGLTKEGLNIVHDLGLSVSYTSIHKKRKSLVQKQQTNIDKVVKNFIQQKRESTSQRESETTSQVSETTCQVSETTDQVSETTGPVSETTDQVSETTGPISGTTGPVSETTDQVSETTGPVSETTGQVSETIGQRVVTETSGQREESETISQQEVSETTDHKTIEVLGDNLDVTISPTHMTKDKQRKSLHWFLTMVKQRRVTYEDLNLPGPVPEQPTVTQIPSYEWIPSEEQMKNVMCRFKFHISRVLLKYIEFLKPLANSYPEYISHPFLEITQRKSVILNSNLINESENSSQGMIKILQQVQDLTVPIVENDVIQRVVFGGDVLTNERAFSAQEAMQNNLTSQDRLFGVIHRPEGLHRQFNFLLVTLPL